MKIAVLGRKRRTKNQADWIRVCNRCGYRWLLPEEWATETAPSDWRIKRSERSAKYVLTRHNSMYAMRAMALQSQRDRVLGNARCSQCGSSDYTQFYPL